MAIQVKVFEKKPVWLIQNFINDNVYELNYEMVNKPN